MESTSVAIAESSSDEAIGAIFAALADPTRRRLVELLAEGDATVNELASRVSVGVPAVSKHLTVLARARLISRHREAQWRRCSLERESFDRMQAWAAHYSRLWEGSLDNLADYLDGEDTSEDRSRD